MNVKHLHLHVQDRGVAETFYRDRLGLRLLSHGDVLSFMGDEDGFELALMDDPSPAPMPPWFHFGVKLASTEAVANAHARLQRDGVPIVRPFASDERLASFRCSDPDGYVIEVYWQPDLAG